MLISSQTDLFPNQTGRQCIWWSVVICLLCLSGLLARPCLAQPSEKRDSGADTLLKEAERLYLAGIRLAQKSQFSEALAKFRAAYRIVPSARRPKNELIRGTLHLLIGRTYHRMSRWQNARNHYRKYLQILKEDNRRSQVMTWLKALRPYLAATLKLETTPPANCVVSYPGGKWRGETPATIALESGDIRIQCEASLYKTSISTLKIAPKSTETTALILVPLPKPPPPPKDYRWVGLVIGGLGIATLGTGGLFGGLALQDQNEAVATRDAAVSNDDSATALRLYSGAQTKALAANVMYGVGGGLAITGLILYFVLRPRSTPPKSALLNHSNPHKQRARTFAFAKGATLDAHRHRGWQGIGTHERISSWKTSATPQAPLAQP